MSHYDEPFDLLDEKTRCISRAINSLREELEAVNYYHQRVATTGDKELKAILAHNRDEEIEHACMALEWIRRNMDGWDEELKTFLFTQGDLTRLEEGGQSRGTGSLGIGKLKSS